MADAPDSKSGPRKRVWVQVPPSVLRTCCVSRPLGESRHPQFFISRNAYFLRVARNRRLSSFACAPELKADVGVRRVPDGATQRAVVVSVISRLHRQCRIRERPTGSREASQQLLPRAFLLFFPLANPRGLIGQWQMGGLNPARRLPQQLGMNLPYVLAARQLPRYLLGKVGTRVAARSDVAASPAANVLMSQWTLPL